MEELRQIIKDLKDLCIEEELNVTPDVLFDASVRILNSQAIHRQGSKFESRYPSGSSLPPTPAQPNSSPATDKQKNLLKKLGYKGDYVNITKIKAMEEIDKRIQ